MGRPAAALQLEFEARDDPAEGLLGLLQDRRAEDSDEEAEYYSWYPPAPVVGSSRCDSAFQTPLMCLGGHRAAADESESSGLWLVPCSRS